MKFKEIVSVSGISGLKRIIGQRVDGLILADLDDTNRRFYSIKKGGFKNGETPDPVFDQTHADHFTNQSGRDPVVGKSKK